MTQAEDFKRAMTAMSDMTIDAQTNKIRVLLSISEQAAIVIALQRAINEPQFHDNHEGAMEELGYRKRAAPVQCVPETLSDEQYEQVIKDVRKHLELGFNFGSDPIEQIVFLVHRAILNGLIIKESAATGGEK